MIDEWIIRFARKHILWHPHAGIPDPDSADGATFFEGWARAFEAAGLVDYDVAVEASIRLMTTEHYRNNHLATLLELARDIDRGRALRAGHGHAPGSREAVMSESKDCSLCGGAGLIYLTHRVVATCECPYGRWINDTWDAHPEWGPNPFRPGSKAKLQRMPLPPEAEPLDPETF